MFAEPRWLTPRYVLDGDLFDASAQYWLSEAIIFSLGETRYAAPVWNEKLFIAGEQIMFIRMLRKPRGPHRPDADNAVRRRGEAKRIREVMRHPAAAAVIHLRDAAAGVRLRERVHQIKQRLVAFGEITNFRRPVIHLDVDVEMIIAVPGGVHFVVPEPLKICGQRSRA